jgi:hypothetical protein
MNSRSQTGFEAQIIGTPIATSNATRLTRAVVIVVAVAAAIAGGPAVAAHLNDPYHGNPLWTTPTGAMVECQLARPMRTCNDPPWARKHGAVQNPPDSPENRRIIEPRSRCGTIMDGLTARPTGKPLRRPIRDRPLTPRRRYRGSRVVQGPWAPGRGRTERSSLRGRADPTATALRAGGATGDRRLAGRPDPGGLG